MTESPLSSFHGHNSSGHSDGTERPVSEEKNTETTVFSLPEKESIPDTNNEEETLLIEQDGDFFWILQRILWGILKTGFVIGAIAFLVWLVWRPEGTEEGAVEPEKVTERDVPIRISEEEPKAKEAEPAQKREAMPMAGVHRGAVTAAEWAEWIEAVEVFEQGHPLILSLDWLKKVSAFLQVPTEELIRGETREERQVRIDTVLSQMWQLIEDSYRLRISLQKEMSELAVVIAEAQSVSTRAGRVYLDSLKNFNALSAQTALDQNVEAQKALVQNKSNFEARKLTLSHMDQYDKFLRNIYQNIRTNRAALIENIQIVFFPDDPFHQILTPAEWQGRQGN